ncbi:MAG: GNAT family N-acetyltransferase [Candidatus Zixiibacteriota bacterium]|nr:MAG: GNAT family N-acetyltransferase [candidate division Zixibacteria bacterium]
MDFTIRQTTDIDRDWVLSIIRGWGADFIVSRGRKLYAAELPGFIAESAGGKKAGLATYEIINDQCELVTLDAFEQFRGIGTALTEQVRLAAIDTDCTRLWLITTNDNLDAIRFYQRRGFTIATVHVNALEYSRKLKPSIARIGQHGIPLRDEIVFEMAL